MRNTYKPVIISVYITKDGDGDYEHEYFEKESVCRGRGD